MKILGVRFGHDSSAALIVDGEIIADVSEERFSRVKNDTSFPVKSIIYCLEFGGIKSEDLDVLAIPTKTYQKEFGVFFDIPKENIPAQDISLKQKGKNYIKKVIEKKMTCLYFLFIKNN